MESDSGNVVEGVSNLESHHILIAPDSVPRLTYESIPVEATSDAVGVGVNESSLKRELYSYALNNMWQRAKSIYDEFPDMVRIPLTASGDTALHVAVSANNSSSTFVKELVNLEYMTPKDLEIPNVDGNTAFCMAAITGNGDLFQIMIDKNENLPIIPGHDGMLPVHLAALTGYHKNVHDLSTDDLLQKMDFKHIQQLFLMTINCSMYDVATKLLEKYLEKLVVARYDKDQLTALHMLVRKPSEEFYMPAGNNMKGISTGRVHQFELLQKVWCQVRQLEYNNLITHPSVVLFDAVKSGNVEAVKWLLYMNSELLTIRDPKNGRNLLHFAVLYGQRSLFHFIRKMRTVNLVIRAVDKDRNNVLHFAAHHQPEETSISSLMRNNILMQRELVWFKEVKNGVPPELSEQRNSDGKTPEEIYYYGNAKFYTDLKEGTLAIANSGMVVATLIAAVAFAAAFTVPGDKNSKEFIAFFMANAVALFTSSASIVSFLTISVSPRFADSRMFIFKAWFILTLTLTSVASMVIAFIIASFLTFDHEYKEFAYMVAVIGFLLVSTAFLSGSASTSVLHT